MLDLESWASGSIVTVFICFHIVKPLMTILALLPISSSLWKPRVRGLSYRFFFRLLIVTYSSPCYTIIFTTRNEVGARLYFHRHVWFCSWPLTPHTPRADPPGADPLEQTHPLEQTPPQSRPSEQTPPGADTAWEQTPPGTKCTPWD